MSLNGLNRQVPNERSRQALCHSCRCMTDGLSGSWALQTMPGRGFRQNDLLRDRFFCLPVCGGQRFWRAPRGGNRCRCWGVGYSFGSRRSMRDDGTRAIPFSTGKGFAILRRSLAWSRCCHYLRFTTCEKTRLR